VWSIAVAVFATVFGIVAIAFAMLLLSRDRASSAGWILARRSQAPSAWAHWEVDALCILAAGVLLVVGGQYKLYRLLSAQVGDAAETVAIAEARAKQAAQAAVRAAHAVDQATSQAQVQSLLQAPFEALTVRVHGPDPFHEQAEACSLRLRVTTQAGSSLVTEVPAGQLRALPGAASGHQDYLLAWQSILEGPTTAQGRKVAATIARIGDWQRMSRVEADLVVRAAEEIPTPASLEFVVNDKPLVRLFQGQKASGEGVHQGDTWVGAYRDAASPTDHLASVRNARRPVAAELESLPEMDKPMTGGLGFIFTFIVAVGVLLLGAGVWLRFRGIPVAQGDHAAADAAESGHANEVVRVSEQARANAEAGPPPSARQGATR
jgi:hypothetical protein